MDSICRFLPPKEISGNLKAVHFVYETEFPLQKQPFLRPIYYLHLVTSGTATMRVGDTVFDLKEGSLFFFFPGTFYFLDGDADFRYAYISFMGTGAPELLEQAGVRAEQPVFSGFSHLVELWLSSVVRVNHTNANILTESVLLYTLSYIPKDRDITDDKKSENLLHVIVDYVDTHYRESALTLRQVADIFAYTENYLSRFFKAKMGVGFNEYLNRLRLQYAVYLIGEGATSVSQIALQCGFSDPLYFSKVFKKKEGISPREYIQKERK